MIKYTRPAAYTNQLLIARFAELNVLTPAPAWTGFEDNGETIAYDCDTRVVTYTRVRTNTPSLIAPTCRTSLSGRVTAGPPYPTNLLGILDSTAAALAKSKYLGPTS